MKNRCLLLVLTVVLLGVAISASSYAIHEEGQIVCPPATGTLSNAETAAALRTAIGTQDYAAIQQFLTHPNFSQLRDLKDGYSPLHMAVSPCQVGMVQLVLTQPPDLNARDDTGMTPLHAAVSCDRDILDRILNLPGSDLNVLYSNQRNPPTSFNQKLTPLHEAAWHGYVAGVTALLEYGAHPNPRNSVGFTPLHLAATMNRSEIARILLNYGANPNARDDEKGRTPLHLAIPLNDTKDLFLFEVLLADTAADSEAEDYDGRTLLHMAAFRNSEKAARLLLKHGVDPNAEDDKGKTPLHLAAYYADIDLVELLLDFGADPRLKDDFRNTPSKFADRRDRFDVIDLLDRHN